MLGLEIDQTECVKEAVEGDMKILKLKKVGHHSYARISYDSCETSTRRFS